jgi:protein SCO1/2
VEKIKQKKNKKWLMRLMMSVALMASLIVYFGVLRTHEVKIQIEGVYLPQATKMVPFKLTDNRGNLFTQENLKGHWTMLFFGFTHCGFVCPSTLAELNKMHHQLQKELPLKAVPQIVFISVDPQRDTLKRLNEYVTAFNVAFIGLRGSELATEKLENQLHIMAAKSEMQGKNNYTLDHTAEILLINPQAEIQAYLSYPHQATQMIRDYKKILSVSR